MFHRVSFALHFRFMRFMRFIEFQIVSSRSVAFAQSESRPDGRLSISSYTW
jgi:hypothetical protein